MEVERELKPDLMLVYLPGIDRVSHFLWPNERPHEATLVLDAQMGDGESANVSFKVPPGGSSTNVIQDFTLTVMELEPQTVSTKRIGATEYVAKILLSRS